MTNHLEQTATAVVVLLVCLQMLGQILDPIGQDRNLYFRGACVTLVDGILLNNRLFFFCCHFCFHLSKTDFCIDTAATAGGG